MFPCVAGAACGDVAWRLPLPRSHSVCDDFRRQLDEGCILRHTRSYTSHSYDRLNYTVLPALACETDELYDLIIPIKYATDRF